MNKNKYITQQKTTSTELQAADFGHIHVHDGVKILHAILNQCEPYIKKLLTFYFIELMGLVDYCLTGA